MITKRKFLTSTFKVILGRKLRKTSNQDLIVFTETTRQRKKYLTPPAWELYEINFIGKLTDFFTYSNVNAFLNDLSGHAVDVAGTNGKVLNGAGSLAPVELIIGHLHLSHSVFFDSKARSLKS